ncbi:MAG: metallophosphoesterase [Thermicanus sp.]|nr:metallophosphoesterase [Thermicanus sp.]
MASATTCGNGQIRTYDMVSINWIGWKYVDVAIPGDVPLPISLDYIYMVETNKSLHYKGTVYFDDIRFVYSDEEDLQGPTFSNFLPSKGTVYAKDVPISLDISDDKSGVDPQSIRMTLDGQDVVYQFEEKEGVVSVTYFAQNLAEGKHLLLVEARDKAGNYANPPFSREFTVNLQKDTLPPDISNLLPLDGSSIPTSTPRISVKITDQQSGVDAKDIEFYLDGERQTPYYDEATGIAYLIPSPLADGSHTVRVMARDRAGNQVDYLVLARDLAQDLGATLAWDEITRSITFTKENTTLVMTIDSFEAVVNGEKVTLSMPARIINNSSYVPVGFIKSVFPFSEELNAKYPDGLQSTFTVKAIGQPKDPEHFQISLTSDTHATGYAPYFFRMVQEDESQLVIQNGDVVDNDLPEQWATAAEQLKLINKPILFSPGNHEAFKGSLTNYMNTYGLPPYTFEYGNTLLISLNTALGQSITASDPSQFDYLKKVLERN